MSNKKLHVFIDGSWLFKIGSPEGVLASKTDRPTKPFSMDFKKLNQALLSHVSDFDPECQELGDLYYATSVFNIPEDIDEWPTSFPDITSEQVEIVKKNVYARNLVAQNAIDAGYKEDAIYHPKLRGYIVKRLFEKTYQEKQVDASVVALLVRSAIINPDDYHVVITGDSDILPAIQVAYPEYSENVFVATSHPDELSADHRHTSYSIHNFEFKIDSFYFQDHIVDLIHGNNAYNCGQCNKVFTTFNPVPHQNRPYCSNCRAQRDA
jgi:hypothetical protein